VIDLQRLSPGTLVPVVTQDAVTGVVLMLAWADREALERTLATGEMHYRSRTRGLWHKGGTSGNTQRLVSLAWDCDADTVLARVVPAGPACHEGTVSCFRDDALGADAVGALDRTIAARAAVSQSSPGGAVAPAPASAGAGVASPGVERTGSYTRELLADRNRRLKKLGEEAAELAVACADGDRDRAVSEAADLVYHALVALRALGAGLDDVRAELARRAHPGPIA
jgi:phosphoribosyl-ATP pyrophosphohydrolase/phosphoribosyl-AMP cyclohydrolase